MKKQERQALIRELIQKYQIETQEELLSLLVKRGIKATQTTTSRDIRELKIVKKRGSKGKMYYAILDDEATVVQTRLKQHVQETVKKITQVQFVNIIQTTINSANVLAALLDEWPNEKIAGTLAGVDTLVIFSPDETQAQEIHELFQSYLQSKNSDK